MVELGRKKNPSIQIIRILQERKIREGKKWSQIEGSPLNWTCHHEAESLKKKGSKCCGEKKQLTHKTTASDGHQTSQQQ
jgi:hypothetical protein